MQDNAELGGVRQKTFQSSFHGDLHDVCVPMKTGLHYNLKSEIDKAYLH